MISKRLTTFALTAGCAMALAAAASAQPYPQQTAPQTNQTYNYQQQAYNAPPQVVTNGPQASAGDRGGWSARENVIESAHYDRLLETSLSFRRFRERKECGPVTDPQLRSECFSSFRTYEPFRYAGRFHRGAPGTPTTATE
jgi:hypothetical protein